MLQDHFRMCELVIVLLRAGKPSEGVGGDRDALLAAIRGGKFQLRRTPQPGAAPQPGGA